MNTHTGKRLACAAVLVAAYSSVTLAQGVSTSSLGGGIGTPHEKTKQWLFTVGAGVGTMPDYEGGDDYEAVPIPILRAQKGHRFGELLGLHITSNILNSKHWRLGPSYNWRQGYSSVENDRVDALTDRGSSHELGLKGGYEFVLKDDRTLDLAVEFLADVSSGHEGMLVTPSVEFGLPINKEWSLGLGADITYASGDYMSHFFSINERESLNSGLDNFDADADFKDVAGHVKVGYALTKKWNIIAYGEYKRMLGDAEDSPVVDDEGSENQYFGAMAVTYSW